MRATTAVSLLVLFGFVAAARGVGNLYPVSQFPMYAGNAGPSTAHVMLLGRDGAYVEVDSVQALTCESLPALDAQRCDDASAIPYLAREAEQFIRAHPASGSGVDVELVLRVWSFDGKTRPAHCVVAKCTAVSP